MIDGSNRQGQWVSYKDGKSLTSMRTIDSVKYFFNTVGTLKLTGRKTATIIGTILAIGRWLAGRLSAEPTLKKTSCFTKDGWIISGNWYYFYADGSLDRSVKVDAYETCKDGVRKANSNYVQKTRAGTD